MRPELLGLQERVRPSDRKESKCRRLHRNKTRPSSWKRSICCSTSVITRLPRSFGHLTTSNIAPTFLRVVRACSVSLRAFRRPSNMSTERLWLKGISSWCTDDFRTSASLRIGLPQTLCALKTECLPSTGMLSRTKLPRKGHRVDCQCLAKSLVNDPPCDCRSWSKRLSCSTSGKFQGIRKRTVTFNSPTILSSWLRRSCRRSSEQYRSCSVLSRLGNRRLTGSRNWNVWIGRLETRFQIGVRRRWSQAPG